MSSERVLKLPVFVKPFYLTIGFSGMGYGACLMQKHSDVLCPIAFRSKIAIGIEASRPQYLIKLESLW